jgi:L-alanine-DL-glutamate epimerase-like enolase superfamily enzyme
VKITGVKATPVRMDIPAAPYTTEGAGTKREWGRLSRLSPKRPTPMLEYVLVHIETDEGIVGIGEAQADIGFFGETVEGIRAAVDDYLGPQLIGRDPFDREHLMHLIAFRGNTCARSAIDLALHDIVGKALGASAAVLLGGHRRERVPCSVEIAGGPPDEMAAECVSLMGQGVRAFKLKIGGYPDADANRMQAVREAVGKDVSLRADANQGYSPKEAIAFCRLCETRGLGLELLEQPVAVWDLHGMAQVRRSVDTLIEADEACYSVHDAMQIVRHEAADVLNVKLGKAGGFLEAKKIAALAESAGLRCVLGTAFGLGVEIAAKCHLFASTESVADAVEFTEVKLHANLLQRPHDRLLSLPLDDGCMQLPTGPGLGVELDDLAVQQHRL